MSEETTEAEKAAFLEELRAMVGQTGSEQVARDPVNLPTVRNWCDAMSEANPNFTDPDAAASGQQPDSAALAAGAWPLYCQHSHAWLMLSGEPKAAMMAKLCGVDLGDGAFPLGQVAQTQMAQVGQLSLRRAHWHRNGSDTPCRVELAIILDY